MGCFGAARIAGLLPLALIVAGCSAPLNPIGPKTDSLLPTGAPEQLFSGAPAHTVQYEVTGTASTAELAWIAPDGLHRQTVGLPLPQDGEDLLRFQFPPGAQVSVSLTNGTSPGRSTAGKVSCRIFIDGQDAANQAVSSGAAGSVAACSTTVP
ncbi:hypothetical protein [Sinomonas sp. P47F7]|uniref:hypothetical protein n=1 Tax=Sinomonas sp. P47F7 TaxID=3410987 RepID=UPI003BF524DA